MPRFEQEPDPAFWRLNASLSFDRRLAPYDVRQSRAHARALRGVGVLDDGELDELLSGLDRVEAELESGDFRFDRGDEDIHMAIARRTLAGEHRDARLPGYTHLQRAQPVSLGHHLLAWFWMLRRDVDRFDAAAAAAGAMPLGSGALAGLNWDLDREAVATELGFDRLAENSIDGVSNRDFALDYLAAASACSTHLSRVGAEIVLWSTSEFGFCRPAEEFSSGSSIMHQKMNPDAAELLRAKASRVAADLSTLTGILHGLPLAYSKDLQEDKEPLFDAADTIELCLETLAGMLPGIAFDEERMAAAAADELVAATDVADLLVRRGLPFREAHGVVGGLVRHAVAAGIPLSAIPPEELSGFSELLDAEYYEVLGEGSWLESKVSRGGTAAAAVAAQLERAEASLAGLR